MNLNEFNLRFYLKNLDLSQVIRRFQEFIFKQRTEMVRFCMINFMFV
jgi:hypothetical protein